MAVGEFLRSSSVSLVLCRVVEMRLRDCLIAVSVLGDGKVEEFYVYSGMHAWSGEDTITRCQCSASVDVILGGPCTQNMCCKVLKSLQCHCTKSMSLIAGRYLMASLLM